MMKWAESPNGSAYIYRQCMSFIRLNFIQVSKIGVLNLLSTEEMIRLFQDDFLDATELDVSIVIECIHGCSVKVM